ncbi:uncharacterized protein LOC124410907 [Diprion similis]|uniref:uncharacterized protein LOC124410907 n=1 Tax=Diprion similis TaxID=362088 RepID=UPI001EF84515|nr:uncharacterized protein LOC124410907 [Diprion similis]
MKTKSLYAEILAVLLLCQIPWPGPSVFKISCPRDSASVVRRIVQKKWIPVLNKYQVELPLECPFHRTRDIFHPQQAAKYQHRPSQWTCGLCGKSFYEERHLDMHFDNRHKGDINMAEDAVCLADYCDIMRCDVLITQDFEGSSIDDSSTINTDIEVWRETTARQTTLAPSTGSRDLARVFGDKFQESQTNGGTNRGTFHHYCDRRDTPENHFTINHQKQKMIGSEDEENNKTHGICDSNHLVDSALPAIDRNQQRLVELQKLKSNCKPEELLKLKIRCEILVRDCIAGLLVNLSVQDFTEVEGELNRAVCWYLTCEKYWEDTRRQQRQIPWHLLFILAMLLSLGMSMCYYIIWILFDSVHEMRADGMSGNSHSSYNSRNKELPSPQHGSKIDHNKKDSKGKLEPGQDMPSVGSSETPDHYIYVAYPPELKRRLLESCYNRTTRL